jgi:hypothetical protein
VKYTILKRSISVIAEKVVKVYGDIDPCLNYHIVGQMVGDDVLTGELYREKPTSASNPYLFESVGEYNICSTLNNDYYVITFVQNVFVIEPREIYISAVGQEITYGENLEPLAYEIAEGNIISGDSVKGDIYWENDLNVGTYEIKSSLTLGRNYTIHFTKAEIIINPIVLTISSSNYEKIYGQSDPVFNYQITDGSLINGDVILGSITREGGSDVGSYKLVLGLYNQNYVFDFGNIT